MSGLTPTTPLPTALTVHRQSRRLEVEFDDGAGFSLPFEYLRVYSPSAEVRGHGNEVLQTGKRAVEITALEPVGHYAVRIMFSDGHDSGLYTWAYLYELGRDQDALWQDYLQRLDAAGAGRDEELSPLAPAKGGCSHQGH